MKKGIKTFALVLAATGFLFAAAGAAEARMTHKWDHEAYSQGKFSLKKSGYPEKQRQERQAAQQRDQAGDYHVRIDHKGRLSKHPLPPDSPTTQPAVQPQ